MLGLLSIAVVSGLFFTGASPANAQQCPVELQGGSYCDKFVVYREPGSAKVDKRIDFYMPKQGPTDTDVRSFAFLVSVSKYPAFQNPKDQVLQSVEADLPKIIEFLKQQGFDEVIVLKNSDATKEAINYFLEQYLLAKVNDYKRRSRFLFMYDGHGLPGLTANDAGALALSSITGDADGDPSHSYSLDDLQSRLRRISNLAYHSLALIGSCFSGGIFPITSNQGENYSYPRSPGSHAVTAAKADELARAAPDGKGTMFFEALLLAIRKSSADLNTAQFISGGDGMPQKVLGTSIVRLGRVVQVMSEDIEDVTIPGTEPPEPFPQLRVGPMVSDASFNGAFFFLVPIDAEKQATTRGPSLPPAALDLKTTGSAVIGRPDLKVFSPPETYKLRGVDFSAFSGEPKFDELKQSGSVKFLYAKASQGSMRRDSRFERNRAGALRSEILFGAYHVLDCSPADAQIKNLAEVAPPDKNLLPVAIDVEWNNEEGSPIFSACGGDRDIIRSNLKRLLAFVEQTYGKKPIIYTSRRGVSDILQNEFSDYALWYADFAKNTPGYRGDNPWTIWQVTNQGQIDGFERHVDFNVFFGDEDQFQAFASTGANAAREAALADRK
ncbi:glycoside hydrolase family 25 protein [Rhizobium sp. BK176]|uniref:glycoside hydrolase family 25 protein n=1 Tax=Rhizobium sp. BK176 TaxID=2587071 RepID=UPI0021674791|nr:GH25 family lysozyme [Rhizobium sp. BK176]MCS4096113.1 lysozyme [Rhizobium sp. BK176]